MKTERIIKEGDIEFSRVIDIDSRIEGPAVAVIGLVHGNEISGKIVLDELQEKVPAKGRLRLIYANLPAYNSGQECIDVNLNRVFPGSEDGKLEERIAHKLTPELNGLDHVIDIHSTEYPTVPFAISTTDSEIYDELASRTTLDRYVTIPFSMVEDRSLTAYANLLGAQSIAFEGGTHRDPSSVETAKRVVNNLLTSMGIFEGEYLKCQVQKFRGREPVLMPDADNVRIIPRGNFELLPAGTPYAQSDDGEHSLDYDCFPALYDDNPKGNMIFLATE